MRLSEVRARIAEIEDCAPDAEKAHSLEDSLREDVLVAIAKARNLEAARALAREALKTSAMDFPRWCA